jgi:cell division septal protein FtsQ
MRRRRSILRFSVALVLLLMAGGGAVTAFYYQKWRVSEIIIAGNNMVTREVVTEFVHTFINQKVFVIFPGDNILLVQKNELIASLTQAFPRFKDISVSREWPNKLSISVKEREAWGSYCLNKKCYLLDKDGYIFASSPAFEGDLFIQITDLRTKEIHVGERVDLGTPLIDIKNQFEAAAGPVAEIVLISNDEWRIKMSGGWQVLVNGETDLDLATKSLRVSLAEIGKEKLKNLNYIDLRFGKKIFYKFK